VSSTSSYRCCAANQPFYKNTQFTSLLCSLSGFILRVYAIWPTKQIVLTPPNLMDMPIDLLIWWAEMISPSEDRQAERKKQEEHTREVSATRKRNREEELRHLHLLAAEVGVLLGGKTRSSAPADAWMFVDLGENHELSFYHQGDLINIRGRVDGLSYTLNVSPHLPPADIVKAIKRKSAA
jgi:hypothetical protein